jgi:hypothetical protein
MRQRSTEPVRFSAPCRRDAQFQRSWLGKFVWEWVWLANLILTRQASYRSKLHRSEEVRVAAVQEEAEVGVKPVETGMIRVKKIAHEEFEPLALTLHSQNVEVKRVTVGRPVNEKFGERREGGTLTIPVFE